MILKKLLYQSKNVIKWILSILLFITALGVIPWDDLREHTVGRLAKKNTQTERVDSTRVFVSGLFGGR